MNTSLQYNSQALLALIWTKKKRDLYKDMTLACNSEEKSPLQTCVISDLAWNNPNQIKLNICLFVSRVPWVDKARGLHSQATFNLQTRAAKPARLCKRKLNDLDFLPGMQAPLCPARPKEFWLLVWCSKWFTDAEDQIQWARRRLKVNSCNASILTSALQGSVLDA